jgi:TDG/mug DNA glycosylase family protein
VRPTREQLAAAAGNNVPDVIARDLDVLFCGINPGLWSAAVGHHFAHPSNRFWKALHAAGFTPRLLSPSEEQLLLKVGIGITNFVDRASVSADEVTVDELRQGARRLATKVGRWRPQVVAVLGLGAYRAAFSRPGAGVGEQPEPLAGARVWLVPNPSGLQAHYPLDRLAGELESLRRAISPRSA